MKMAYALVVQAHRIYGVAAAKKIMTCIETETEQVRVCKLAQSRDLLRRFDKRTGMMMEDCGQSQFAARSRDAIEYLRCAVPLRAAHPVMHVDNAPGYCHARFAHLIGQNDQTRAGLRQQPGNLHRFLIARLVAFRMSQWNGDEARHQLQPACR